MSNNVPGVSFTEDHGPAAGVTRSDTAVPLFVGDFKNQTSAPSVPLTFIESWADFEERFRSRAFVTLTVQGSSRNAVFSPVSNAHFFSSLALRHYFDNGGGGCYIANNGASSPPHAPVTPDEAWKDIASQDAFHEVTIIVAVHAAVTDRTAFLKRIPAELAGRVVLDEAVVSDGVYVSQGGFNENSHAAAYFPAIETCYALDRSNLYDTDAFAPALVKRSQDLLSADIDAVRNLRFYLPPTPAMAGIMVRTDRERGVWKAPANVALSGVSRLISPVSDGKWVAESKDAPDTLTITDDLHEKLNKANVNAIRLYSSRHAHLVMGARTRAAVDDHRWKFVPVRRLFNALERDIQAALRQAVFEPNSSVTWQKVRIAIDSYLHQYWRDGALQGDMPEQAYAISIGLGESMTAEDLDEGKMIVIVGLAAVRPAEFIELMFTQDVAVSH